jgi:hypothetical protein
MKAAGFSVSCIPASSMDVFGYVFQHLIAKQPTFREAFSLFFMRMLHDVYFVD